jgi:hypothetical protein
MIVNALLGNDHLKKLCITVVFWFLSSSLWVPYLSLEHTSSHASFLYTRLAQVVLSSLLSLDHLLLSPSMRSLHSKLILLEGLLLAGTYAVLTIDFWEKQMSSL